MATLEQLAGFLGAELIGDDAEIARVDSAAQADALALVFAENDAALAVALASGAGAVLARQSVASAGKPILIVRNPRLAFARAAKYLSEKDDRSGNGPQIHATAVLGEEVQLGAGVEIGPHAVIGNRAVLGSNVHIGAGCVIGDGVVIGAGSKLYPRVTVYSGTTMGEHVVVHAGTVLGADGFGYIRNPETGAYTQFPQQGTLVLEDGVEVGANSTIDRGALEETRIGQGTKIDNLVHVGHNVIVGRDVVIAAQTGISGSSTIGDNAIVGGQVGIGDHATVGPGVVLGSGSGVLSHKKVDGPGVVFWGRPARPLRQYLKELATLSKLARRSGSGTGPAGN